MKFYLVIFNALSVTAYLLWFGYHYLKALGSAYGNTNPATGSGDVTFVFLVVAVATAACVTYSVFAPERSGRIIALMPIALVLLGEGYISSKERINWKHYSAAEAVKRSASVSKLNRISKDYLLKPEGRDSFEFKESFLTHDQELGTIVQIDVGFAAQINPYCVGKVSGGHLELFKVEDDLDEFYKKYLDREGKSIYDNYEISYNPNQDYMDYRLEKYEP